MPNDYIDKVTLNGTTYDIRDNSAIHELPPSASVYDGALKLRKDIGTASTIYTANQSGDTTMVVTTSALADAISFTPGLVPTLGTAIAADDITTWTTNTPTSIDTTKFSGGSFTRGAFSGGSFTQGSDSFTKNTPTAVSFVIPDNTSLASPGTLNISVTAGTQASFTQGTDSFTAATHGNDSFTAATLNTGFYSAGTAANLSYSSKSIPNVTNVGSAPSLTITDRFSVVVNISST